MLDVQLGVIVRLDVAWFLFVCKVQVRTSIAITNYVELSVAIVLPDTDHACRNWDWDTRIEYSCKRPLLGHESQICSKGGTPQSWLLAEPAAVDESKRKAFMLNDRFWNHYWMPCFSIDVPLHTELEETRISPHTAGRSNLGKFNICFWMFCLYLI